MYKQFAREHRGLIAGQVVCVVALHFCEVFGLALLLGSTVSALETRD
jgi:hypothetical protein